MILREHHINKDFQEIINSSIFKQSFSGQSDLFSYSSFSTYFNPYTFFIVSKRKLSISEQITKVSIDSYFEEFKTYEALNKNFNQRLNFLLKQSTWMHEVRHFHDCFSTSTGIQDFIKTVTFIDDIIKELKVLKADGGILKESLNETYLHENKSSDYYKRTNRLLQLCFNLKIYKTLFNGDLPPIITNKDLIEKDIVWLNYKLPDSNKNEFLKVPTSPLEIKHEGQIKSLLQPIGFRALTEAHAVALQNQYLRSFGQDYVSAHTALLRSQPVYVVLNTLFTKLFKNNDLRINEMGGEELIYEYINFSLHNGGVYNPKNHESHPISNILNLLRKTDESNNVLAISDILDNKILLEKEIISSFENITKVVTYWVLNNAWNKSKNGFKETLNDFPSLSSSVHRPIFNLASTGKVPNPPFSIQGNLIGYGEKLDSIKELYEVIIPWIFILDIIDSLVFSKTFKCPIAFSKFGPLKEHNDFVVHESCNSAKPNGVCGKIQVGSNPQKHVNCQWKKTLKSLALIQ